MKRSTVAAVWVAATLALTPVAARADDNGDGGDNNIHFQQIGPVYICIQPGSCTTPPPNNGGK